MKGEKAESIIEKELLVGPKTAKQLVDACAQKGVKRSATFYWLKKMRSNRTVRSIHGKYELIRLKEADTREIDFLLEKIGERNQDVRKAAIEDFTALCRERKVTNHNRVLPFIEHLLKHPRTRAQLRNAALRFLRFITVNSKRTKDAKAMEELARFKGILKVLILKKNLDQSLRHEATIVLDVLLNDSQGPLLFRLLRHILEETAQKPEGENQPFQVVGLYLWHIILKRAAFPVARDELRRQLYGLLEHENRRMRDMSLRLLDELRMKEYGFELWPLSTTSAHAENIS